MSGRRIFKKNKMHRLPKSLRDRVTAEQHMRAGLLQRASSSEVFDGDEDIAVDNDGTVIVTGRNEVGRVIPPDEQ